MLKKTVKNMIKLGCDKSGHGRILLVLMYLAHNIKEVLST